MAKRKLNNPSFPSNKKLKTEEKEEGIWQVRCLTWENKHKDDETETSLETNSKHAALLYAAFHNVTQFIGPGTEDLRDCIDFKVLGSKKKDKIKLLNDCIELVEQEKIDEFSSLTIEQLEQINSAYSYCLDDNHEGVEYSIRLNSKQKKIHDLEDVKNSLKQHLIDEKIRIKKQEKRFKKIEEEIAIRNQKKKEEIERNQIIFQENRKKIEEERKKIEDERKKIEEERKRTTNCPKCDLTIREVNLNFHLGNCGKSFLKKNQPLIQKESKNNQNDVIVIN